MCGDGGARESSDRAAAEAQRQAQLERERLMAEAELVKVEAEKRAREEQARWEAQFNEQRATAEAFRKQVADQETYRLSEQARIENERRAEREAELARQEQERLAAEAAAAKRAEDLKTYNSGRQTLVDDARKNVEAAFAPYNDDYFTGYTNEYIDSLTPQLQRQYADARKQTKFVFANRGNLDSMAAGQRFGRLEDERVRGAARIGQEAQSAANTLRTGIDSQRAKLLEGIFGALNAAPVITADNVGESNDALQRISTALTNPVSLAGSSAASFNLPAYGGTLDPNIFSLPSAQAPRTSVASGAGANSYAAVRRGGGSGRLVA